MQRNIVLWPDPGLNQPTEPVTKFGEGKLGQLVADMFTTMKEWRGVGLAAPQVGLKQSILVYDIEEETGYMINPVLLEHTNQETYKVREGCLSFPDIFVEVERFKEIRVGWQDVTGAEMQQVFTGNVAHCIQHEMDHLEGKTFLDRLSKLKRDMILRKMKKFNKKLDLLNKHLHV